MTVYSLAIGRQRSWATVMKVALYTVGWVVTLACALITLAANFRYGLQVTAGPERYVWAIGGACLDGIKTLLPLMVLTALATRSPLGASSSLLRARLFCGIVLWALLLVWSFFCAMQVNAASRDARVGEITAEKARFERSDKSLTDARTALDRLDGLRSKEKIQAEIDALKFDKLYSRSSGCQNATAPESRTLCASIASLEGERAQAMDESEIRTARQDAKQKQGAADSALDAADWSQVATATDAGTQGLADSLGWSVSDLRRRLALFYSFLLEVGGSLGGWILTGGHVPEFPARAANRRESDNKTVPVAPPIIDKPKSKAETDDGPEPFTTWADQFLVRRKGTFTPAAEMRAAFNSWAIAHGHDTLNTTAFGRKMTKRRHTRKKLGGEQRYIGVTLAPAVPQLRVVSSKS